MFVVPGRPTAVTIIGWYLIFSGAMGILSIPQTMRMQKDPGTRAMMERMPFLREEFKKSFEAAPKAIPLAAVSSPLHILFGIYVLFGANWARIGYVVVTVGGFGATIAMGQPIIFLIPSLVFTALAVIFLFIQPANDFFARKPARPRS